MAHTKHEQIQRRYNYCCGYCGVSEIGTGGELTIDHYRPVSKQGDDSDNNLVYACNRCNMYKSDFFPIRRLTRQNVACCTRYWTTRDCISVRTIKDAFRL